MQTILIRWIVPAMALLVVGCGSSRQVSNSRPTRSGALGNGKNQETRPSRETLQRADNQGPADEKVPESTGKIAPTGYKGKTAYGRERSVDKVIATAKAYLGTPYQFGGSSRKGIDCSALMQLSFQAVGLQLPRTADAQALQGKAITVNQLRPGDLLFFDTIRKGRVGHSALVVAVQNGQVQFIHASVRGGVRVDALDNSYWQKYYLGARRVLP